MGHFQKTVHAPLREKYHAGSAAHTLFNFIRGKATLRYRSTFSLRPSARVTQMPSAKGACIGFAIVAQFCVVYENAAPCFAGCRTEIRAVERVCAKGSGRLSGAQLCRLRLLPK